MRMPHGAWVLATRHQPREMCNVCEQTGAHFVSDDTETGKVDGARVGRSATDNQAGSVKACKVGDFVIVNETTVCGHPVLHGFKPAAG